MSIDKNGQDVVTMDFELPQMFVASCDGVKQYLLLEYTIDDFQGAGLCLFDSSGKIGIWNPRSTSGLLLDYCLTGNRMSISCFPTGSCITNISCIN
ncbi:hypothetical protein [Enterococcus sp. BWR-S5]|uniref:hypothetical protein n=1 Tax=Enterococcus sp. BWR-S5 TaxID=2787714 RepID=UPI00192054AC|nr:hypothetical protein [Enterococcus sp. BWR-S5]MBL1225035.1 hypothetical protein [Enterococcus sp. BWR-S5]